MLFTSFHFLFLFLPIALWVALRLRGTPLLQWLVLASFLFYALEGQPWFLLPMIVTIVLDYAVARQLEKTVAPAARKALLIVSLCGNVGLLGYYKYGRLLAGVGPWGSWFDVVLPAGISFYTFQTLSYIFDVYRREAHAEKNFWKFAGFVTFFPHLVAGPLTRHHQLLPALENIAQAGVRPRWEEGVFLFAVGFCKKILLADRFGQIVDLLLNSASLSPLAAWGVAVGYGFQIYFDFSGYSDMAIGLGRLFGVELPQNFDSPYKAQNPSDFWNRWHITLSRWMRDYVYIPLGGNQGPVFRQVRNLMITMFLGGLWHGAHWNFALWGLYHGVLLAVYHLMRSQWDRWPMAGQRALTFTAVTLGWIFFRADSLRMAADWWKAAFGLGRHGTTDLGLISMMGIFALTGLWIVNAFPNASGYNGFKTLRPAYQAALGLLCALAVLFLNYSSTFLYYQF